MTGNRVARLLRIWASAVENLNEEQLEQLLDGKAKLAFNPVAKKKPTSEGSFEQSALIEELNHCTDRPQAQAVLNKIRGRDALASFARALKVHVVKQDRREDIESKIIEFVIGGKLRTEAIQSLNLKAGSGNVPGSGRASEKERE
jgi:hypothetical protein